MRNNELYQKDIEQISNLSLPWKMLEGKTILISGVTGMIGTVMCDVIMMRNKLFNNNISIIGISRNKDNAKKRFGEYLDSDNFSFVEQDIKEPFEINIKKIDYIIHAASNTHPIQYSSDPIGTILTNVKGTETLWNNAVNHNINRFLFLSSVEIYGENRGDIDKFDEDYLGYINCNTLRAGYPESKRVSEALCRAFACKYGIEMVIARLSRTYGPTMLENDSKVVSQFIKNVANDEDIVLKSEGNQQFSFCYVIDAVSAIFTILLCGENEEAYNVSDVNSDISLKKLAEKIASMSGKNVKFELPNECEKKGYSNSVVALMNSEKLRKLGWRCLNTIDDGLEKTIALLKHGFK